MLYCVVLPELSMNFDIDLIILHYLEFHICIPIKYFNKDVTFDLICNYHENSLLIKILQNSF